MVEAAFIATPQPRTWSLDTAGCKDLLIQPSDVRVTQLLRPLHCMHADGSAAHDAAVLVHLVQQGTQRALLLLQLTDAGMLLQAWQV